MRSPQIAPKPAQEREPDGYGISAHSLFTTADWGSQRAGGMCTEGQGARADGHALLLRAPQPTEQRSSRRLKPMILQALIGTPNDAPARLGPSPASSSDRPRGQTSVVPA